MVDLEWIIQLLLQQCSMLKTSAHFPIINLEWLQELLQLVQLPLPLMSCFQKTVSRRAMIITLQGYA